MLAYPRRIQVSAPRPGIVGREGNGGTNPTKHMGLLHGRPLCELGVHGGRAGMLCALEGCLVQMRKRMELRRQLRSKGRMQEHQILSDHSQTMALLICIPG